MVFLWCLFPKGRVSTGLGPAAAAILLTTGRATEAPHRLQAAAPTAAPGDKANTCVELKVHMTGFSYLVIMF